MGGGRPDLHPVTELRAMTLLALLLVCNFVLSAAFSIAALAAD